MHPAGGSNWRDDKKGYGCPSIPRTTRGRLRTLLRRSNFQRCWWCIGWGKGKEVSNREDERHKGKHRYIASITGGALRLSNHSKCTLKREIIDLMVVSKKEGSTSDFETTTNNTYYDIHFTRLIVGPLWQLANLTPSFYLFLNSI